MKHAFKICQLECRDDVIIALLKSRGVIAPTKAFGPTQNVITYHVRHLNLRWLVIGFFQTVGDEGYVAFGLPLDTPYEMVLNTWQYIMQENELRGFDFEKLEWLYKMEL
jgi:hypothetical protein